ncbi:hypothetical protein, partial [Paenibacillus dendritiformis]|uniref:hypothetical protein n=1 Tax=Paenibacillus dendritiformis TaxID=130049 RepID=UPI001C2519D4
PDGISSIRSAKGTVRLTRWDIEHKVINGYCMRGKKPLSRLMENDQTPVGEADVMYNTSNEGVPA